VVSTQSTTRYPCGIFFFFFFFDESGYDHKIRQAEMKLSAKIAILTEFYHVVVDGSLGLGKGVGVLGYVTVPLVL
jgi:hypothetical protein